MKRIGFFILFLLVGFGLIGIFSYLNYQKNSSPVTNTPLTTKFSLEKAPSESLKGKIASMSGTVLWLSRTANKPTKLKKSQTIQQGEELSTGDNGHASIQIQNDALITLSSNSHVNFIQLLPINFVFAQDKGSTVYQSQGQAISIVSNGLDTAISRGWATISADPVADTVSVSVARGFATEGYVDDQNNSNSVTVNAGQQFVYNTTVKTGSVQ